MSRVLAVAFVLVLGATGCGSGGASHASSSATPQSGVADAVRRVQGASEGTFRQLTLVNNKTVVRLAGRWARPDSMEGRLVVRDTGRRVVLDVRHVDGQTYAHSPDWPKKLKDCWVHYAADFDFPATVGIDALPVAVSGLSHAHAYDAPTDDASRVDLALADVSRAVPPLPGVPKLATTGHVTTSVAVDGTKVIYGLAGKRIPPADPNDFNEAFDRSMSELSFIFNASPADADQPTIVAPPVSGQMTLADMQAGHCGGV